MPFWCRFFLGSSWVVANVDDKRLPNSSQVAVMAGLRYVGVLDVHRFHLANWRLPTKLDGSEYP